MQCLAGDGPRYDISAPVHPMRHAPSSVDQVRVAVAKQRFDPARDNELLNLAPHFRVSLQAMTTHLTYLELIPGPEGGRILQRCITSYYNKVTFLSRSLLPLRTWEYLNE